MHVLKKSHVSKKEKFRSHRRTDSGEEGDRKKQRERKRERERERERERSTLGKESVGSSVLRWTRLASVVFISSIYVQIVRQRKSLSGTF